MKTASQPAQESEARRHKQAQARTAPTPYATAATIFLISFLRESHATSLPLMRA